MFYLRHINLFLRSCVVFLYDVIIVPPYSFLLITSRLFPLAYRHAIIRSYLAGKIALLKYICHINYQVLGLEHIPNNANGIIFSKHQSTWETFFLPLVFHEPAIILKKQLLRIPFFGWGLAAMEPIAIDREATSTAMQQIIAQGQKCLEEGRWILVFPEGTRMAPGTVGNYKLGGARLAEATGYPVLPIAHNAGRSWPRGSFIKRPGTITMMIGPLIETKGRTAQEILTLAKDWIETTMRGL
jgi:1-acyl-sn-glycerol-3-phosphate acyltransferase